MKNRTLFYSLLCILILLPISQAWAVFAIRTRDLTYNLVPPNPVMTWGIVSSVSPMRIQYGNTGISVSGLSGLGIGDCLFVQGDWDGKTLTAGAAPNTTHAYNAVSSTEMLYVPAGSFLMGNNGSEPAANPDEFPQHSVYLSGYWIGKYEVTRGEYRKFMNAGGYSNPLLWSAEGWTWKTNDNRMQPSYWDPAQNWGTNDFVQTDNSPVIGITYYEAEAFCNWAGGHLPTEAQWEKAARWNGSRSLIYPWGDTWDVEKCNNMYDHNPAGGGYQLFQTAPVGSYPDGVSPYGCYDMAGNVAEMTRDWYQSDYYTLSPADGWVDPNGPVNGTDRTLRGGGWYKSTPDYRCAKRDTIPIQANWLFFGFRFCK